MRQQSAGKAMYNFAQKAEQRSTSHMNQATLSGLADILYNNGNGGQFSQDNTYRTHEARIGALEERFAQTDFGALGTDELRAYRVFNKSLEAFQGQVKEEYQGRVEALRDTLDQAVADYQQPEQPVGRIDSTPGITGQNGGEGPYVHRAAGVLTKLLGTVAAVAVVGGASFFGIKQAEKYAPTGIGSVVASTALIASQYGTSTPQTGYTSNTNENTRVLKTALETPAQPLIDLPEQPEQRERVVTGEPIEGNSAFGEPIVGEPVRDEYGASTLSPQTLFSGNVTNTPSVPSRTEAIADVTAFIAATVPYGEMIYFSSWQQEGNAMPFEPLMRTTAGQQVVTLPGMYGNGANFDGFVDHLSFISDLTHTPAANVLHRYAANDRTVSVVPHPDSFEEMYTSWASSLVDKNGKPKFTKSQAFQHANALEAALYEDSSTTATPLDRVGRLAAELDNTVPRVSVVGDQAFVAGTAAQIAELNTMNQRARQGPQQLSPEWLATQNNEVGQ